MKICPEMGHYVVAKVCVHRDLHEIMAREGGEGGPGGIGTGEAVVQSPASGQFDSKFQSIDSLLRPSVDLQS